MALNDNIVTAFITLSASIIGGLITLRGTKLASDKEDRRRRDEILREAAIERIKNLYEPLLRLMSPQPPFDDFSIDHRTRLKIFNFIEKNERYASPDLLNLFWSLRFEYSNNIENFDGKSDIALYETVSAEYKELKMLLGYGPILRKSFSDKPIFKRIRSHIESKIIEWRRKRFSKRISKNRRKLA